MERIQIKCKDSIDLNKKYNKLFCYYNDEEQELQSKNLKDAINECDKKYPFKEFCGATIYFINERGNKEPILTREDIRDEIYGAHYGSSRWTNMRREINGIHEYPVNF